MRYLYQGQSTYSFEDHLRSQPDDPISHFILERWCEIPRAKLLVMSAEQKFSALNDCLSNFWFVADVDYTPELVRLICLELGVPTQAKLENTSLQWQTRVNWRILKRQDLTARQLRMVSERTELDDALWHTWRDAGLSTKDRVPVALQQNAGLRQYQHELQRPLYAFNRRWKRGWN